MSVEQMINDTPTNQEPRTNNHKPVKTKETQSSIAPCDWIPQSAWSGYMEMRKKKRKEPTARAVELLVAELEKLKALGHDIAAVLDKSTPNARSSPIDWLFGELYGMYGNQFLDKFRSGHIVDDVDTGIENMKIVWTEKIRSRHMTMGELKRGLSACDRVKFPPSWSEFLELCKPSVDPLTAYYEAVAGVQARAAGEMGTWSHPAIYWAAMPLAFDLGT